VNSFWDIERDGQDRWRTAAELAEWLRRRSLLGPRTKLDQGDLRRAIDVREGLRALLFVNNGAEPDQLAIERLNRELRAARLFVQLDPRGRPDFVPSGRDLDTVLGLIAVTVATAQYDGRWPRFKACRGEHCGWGFYDHSRNLSSSWCSMSMCGARAKAREYRRRKRAERSDRSATVRQPDNHGEPDASPSPAEHLRGRLPR
jgi:predicted RNA-binding Zn ribbon-like protein